MTSTPKTYSNPFYIYLRKPRSKLGKPIYYVQFKCENSKSTMTTAKSTGTSNYAEAIQIAWKWYSSEKIPIRINGKKAKDKSFQHLIAKCKKGRRVKDIARGLSRHTSTI